MSAPCANDFKTLHRQMKRAITRERCAGWPSEEVRIAAELLRLLLKTCTMNKGSPEGATRRGRGLYRKVGTGASCCGP